MDKTTRNQRDVLASHLDRTARALDGMLSAWMRHDLPGDFLAADEFPFARSLEDTIAEVAAAAELIRSRNDDAAEAQLLPDEYPADALDADTVAAAGFDPGLRDEAQGVPWTAETLAAAVARREYTGRHLAAQEATTTL